jgi:uncharacterized damage-inducible protein DinB
MKTIAVVLLGLLSCGAMLHAQDNAAKPPTTLKGVLLEQLRSTHNAKDWFVDANTAVAGLTPEQANWTDGKGNHSVGQLAYHLVFWNQQELAKLKGETPAKFSGNNDETFNNFDSKKWTELVHQLDQVMVDLEKAVEAADDKKLAANASMIAHIGTHNAYHVGQIVFVRKEQGSWDPEKGVK